MKRWRIRLLLLLAPIAFLLIAGGALLLQPSGQAQAAVGTGDSISCSAASAPVDGLVVAPDSAGTSLGSTTDSPALSATCYFVGITIFPNGCGGDDLYVLRYLCQRENKAWYYVNYGYCV